MAAGAFSLPVGDPLVVRFFSKEVARVLGMNDLLAALSYIGEGSENIIQIKSELNNGGRSIEIPLRGNSIAGGIPGTTAAEGNETAADLCNQLMNIGQLRHATKSKGKAEEQNVLFDFRQLQLDDHMDWWSERFTTTIMSRLSGTMGTLSSMGVAAPYYNVYRSHDTGDSADYNWDGNAYEAPTRLYYGGSVTSAGSLTSANPCTLDEIERLVLASTVATSTTFRPIAPVKVGRKKVLVCIIHPWMLHNMRTDTSGRYYDIGKAKIQGGWGDSPLLDGAVGVLECHGFHVVLMSHEAVIKISASDTVLTAYTVNAGRILLLGRQAGLMAFGKIGKNGDHYDTVEKLHDYDDKLGIASTSQWGVVKGAFTNAQGTDGSPGSGVAKTDVGVACMDVYISAAA